MRFARQSLADELLADLEDLDSDGDNLVGPQLNADLPGSLFSDVGSARPVPWHEHGCVPGCLRHGYLPELGVEMQRPPDRPLRLDAIHTNT